jgi:hypothetical protein
MRLTGDLSDDPLQAAWKETGWDEKGLRGHREFPVRKTTRVCECQPAEAERADLIQVIEGFTNPHETK